MKKSKKKTKQPAKYGPVPGFDPGKYIKGPDGNIGAFLFQRTLNLAVWQLRLEINIWYPRKFAMTRLCKLMVLIGPPVNTQKF